MITLKPISECFGFWLLFFLAAGMSFKQEPTAACVCLVGAILFNAIKAKDK